MHAKIFLHELLGNAIHKSRVTLLTQVTTAIIKTKVLQLSSVGRSLELAIQERSGIRKVDRLLGNAFFQTHSKEIYAQIIRCVVSTKTRPLIIVDWTKLPNTEHYALRAAIAAESRAITLYEEVHPKKKEGNAAVHQAFLMQLQQLLPSTCRPIIITDAGFKNPWFKVVLSLGWDFIGRVRGLTKSDAGEGYKPCKELHSLASPTPRYLGDWLLARKNPLKVGFYLVSHKLRGRKKRNKNSMISTHKDSRNYSNSYREPWVLVSSLKGFNVAGKVVKIYKKRMTIEEGFRDLKSTQYGFSMSENHTIRKERLIVWLLISALASLFAWVMGQAAEKRELHYQFQANSIRHRRVLSFFYLGCQIIRKKIKIPINLQSIVFDPMEVMI